MSSEAARDRSDVDRQLRALQDHMKDLVWSLDLYQVTRPRVRLRREFLILLKEDLTRLQEHLMRLLPLLS
jgi:hypothetical protein